MRIVERDRTWTTNGQKAGKWPKDAKAWGILRNRDC